MGVYADELSRMFVNTESLQKKIISGHRALRWERGYRIGVSKSVSLYCQPVYPCSSILLMLQESAGSLGDVINTYFGSGDDVKDNGNPVLSGFKVKMYTKLIPTSLLIFNANRK